MQVAKVNIRVLTSALFYYRSLCRENEAPFLTMNEITTFLLTHFPMRYHTENEEPQPHVVVAFGLSIINCSP